MSLLPTHKRRHLMTNNISELAKLEVPCSKHPAVASVSQKRRLAIQCDTCKGTGVVPRFPWARVLPSDVLGWEQWMKHPGYREAELSEIDLVMLVNWMVENDMLITSGLKQFATATPPRKRRWLRSGHQ